MKIISTAAFFAHLLLLACSVNALIPLTIKGKRFIKPNTDASVEGEVFYIKGIDYQPGGSSGYSSSSGTDALSDADACYRDAYAFQQLGINTVRIYTLNPDVNHDECMTILNNAGIYLILDVNSGEESLNRANPSGSYNAGYLTRVFKFIEAFKGYPNVIGFFSGNEVINDQSNYAEITPNYIRAVQRDMKEYIAKHSNRTIPVGYSAADSITLRRATFEYLQCFIDGDEDDMSRSDFFGLNSYEWCSGTSTWATSGYGELNSTMANTTLPLFFSEFGCNTNSPRTFAEVDDGLFNGLLNTFSGGLVYEYTQEASNYGLVDLSTSNGSITYREDFLNLKNQYVNASIPTILEEHVNKADIVTCDADIVTEIYSNFGANFTLPGQPEAISKLIENGVNATNIGKLLDDVEAKKSNYTIYDVSDEEVESATVTFIASDEINTQSGVTASSKAAPTSESTSSSSATASSRSSKGGAAALYSSGLNFWTLFVVAISYFT